jgi:hypothetical protein
MGSSILLQSNPSLRNSKYLSSHLFNLELLEKNGSEGHSPEICKSHQAQ